MTVCPTELPCLKSAKFQSLEPDSEVEVHYKSGASFKGHIEDYKKSGCGLFTWPNGASYEGEYDENARIGKGIQIWQDGSRYVGEFVADLRHGQGILTWANGESYEGTFYKDRRHGMGTYTWPDGSSYMGTFYLDRKEGYGVFKLAGASSSVISGLYKEDVRLGPGVLDYSNGEQDVGLWQGERLVKLCSSFSEAFLMSKHKEFYFDPKVHELYIPVEEEKDNFMSKVTDTNMIEDCLSNKVANLYSDSLDPRSLAVNHDDFDREFFKDTLTKTDEDKVLAWNKTESVIKIQRHVLKHRNSENKTTWGVEKILMGRRNGFQAPGPLEKASIQLLEAAIAGDVEKVEELMVTGQVHPDVSDRNGHTALIGATVNWHIDVINCLLNHGADVNRLSDDGCSALSAGIVFFYPHERFRYNVAEHSQKETSKVGSEEQPNRQTQSNPTKGDLSNRSIGSRIVSQASHNQQIQSQRQLKPLDKIGDVKSGMSLGSIDSGIPQTESSTSNANSHTGRLQFQISDYVNKNSAFQEEDDGDSMIGDDNGEQFSSNISLHYYEIEVSEQLIERCATQLSTNERIVGGRRSKDSAHLGTVRHLAIMKSERELMKLTLDLLLRRGADPNASDVPMPILFFAIKSADVEMVKILLAKGASTHIKLPKEKGGLAPLHIACAIPGEDGIQLTEFLLNAGADPNVRAAEDTAFLNRTLEEEWSRDTISPESKALLGGRTPLQIACSRDDNYKNICRVVRLLLDHKANPDFLCNGFSPLALAVASGNDMVVDELLLYGADPSLYLTHGVGSVLCVAMSTQYEHRRSINSRLHLIDKLVKAGADILMPIPIGPKRQLGTAVDYAYTMFNQDRRIAHMPYHALSHAERDTYNARRRLLAHVGDILRIKAVEREKHRIDRESRDGKRSSSPSSGFVYIGAGAPLPPGAHRPKSLRDKAEEGHVTFQSHDGVRGRKDLLPPRKPLFKYCYECGRSVGVRLSPCTRCKEVFYCSKACKLKAWNARHKEECIRIGERSRSPSPIGRKNLQDSPTPVTDAAKGRKTTVASLTKDKGHGRGYSYSAKQSRGRGRGKDLPHNDRRVKSGTCRSWSPPPGVFVDNYSFV